MLLCSMHSVDSGEHLHCPLGIILPNGLDLRVPRPNSPEKIPALSKTSVYILVVTAFSRGCGTSPFASISRTIGTAAAGSQAKARR
jgi:hypothetical protein